MCFWVRVRDRKGASSSWGSRKNAGGGGGLAGACMRCFGEAKAEALRSSAMIPEVPDEWSVTERGRRAFACAREEPGARACPK